MSIESGPKPLTQPYEAHVLSHGDTSNPEGLSKLENERNTSVPNSPQEEIYTNAAGENQGMLHPSEHIHDNQERNEAILAKSEMGVILLDAYQAAIEVDPRVANINILPIENPEDPRHGYASSKESKNNVTGQHEVHIRLDDLDKVLTKYEQAMREAPEAIRIIADQLGVSPEDVTPQTLYVQSILHEMGHLTEHMDAEELGEPRAPIERRKLEMNAMPLGALAVGKLAKPDSAESIWFEDNWQNQAERHGVTTKEELIAIQSAAYRGLTSEKIADNFAADVFLVNPQLLTKLQHGDLDSYKSASTVV